MGYCRDGFTCYRCYHFVDYDDESSKDNYSICLKCERIYCDDCYDAKHDPCIFCDNDCGEFSIEKILREFKKMKKKMKKKLKKNNLHDSV